MTYLRLFFLFIHVAISSTLALIFTLVDRSHKLYFILTKVYSLPVLWIAGIKVKVIGKENFDHKTPYVFVANHLSIFDMPVLQHYVPNDFGFVFKKEILRIPIFGLQMYLGPGIVIDRQNPEKALKSIEKAKKMLVKRKVSVLLFPEGTRSKTGEMLPFKRGAFRIASQVGFSIVPVTISGTQKLIQKKPFKLKPGFVKLEFGKPIPALNVNSRKDELELMAKVRDIIEGNFKKETELGYS
ncbi:MAG TPA: lysophospholipid acyltransferase family protein [Ignavibacteriaceae bacterium]|nr:lysophospholipid acyltransferase family protein [Ignavibacteriaceae bacterium]